MNWLSNFNILFPLASRISDIILSMEPAFSKSTPRLGLDERLFRRRCKGCKVIAKKTLTKIPVNIDLLESSFFSYIALSLLA